MFHFFSAAELRMYSCDGVEIPSVRQPLLAQLRLVPVAVGDDDLPGLTVLHARGDGREHVGQRACPRQVDAGSAAAVMQVIVGQTGDDRLSLEIENRRVGSGPPADPIGLADGGESPVRDGDRLRN